MIFKKQFLPEPEMISFQEHIRVLLFSVFSLSKIILPIVFLEKPHRVDKKSSIKRWQLCDRDNKSRHCLRAGATVIEHFCLLHNQREWIFPCEKLHPKYLKWFFYIAALQKCLGQRQAITLVLIATTRFWVLHSVPLLTQGSMAHSLFLQLKWYDQT